MMHTIQGGNLPWRAFLTLSVGVDMWAKCQWNVSKPTLCTHQFSWMKEAVYPIDYSSFTVLHRDSWRITVLQFILCETFGLKCDLDTVIYFVHWNMQYTDQVLSFSKITLIGDAVSDETVGELCNACNGLHDALTERGMLGRQFKKRSAILRTLFRLIDVGSDRLNLALAKLILAVSI